MSKPSPRTDMEALAVARRNSGIGDEPAIAWALKRIAELEEALLKIFECTYEGDPVKAIAEQALHG